MTRMVSSLVSPLWDRETGTRESGIDDDAHAFDIKLVSGAIEAARTILRRPEGADEIPAPVHPAAVPQRRDDDVRLSRLSLQLLSFDTPDFRCAGKEHQQAAWFHGQRPPDASHDG